MNKIQKLFLTIVCLLATTNVLATDYHITIVNSNPSSGVLSLEANSDVFSGTHAPGTVTIYAKPAETYYLEEIVIEYVKGLGGAESPKRRVDIGIGEKIVLNKTNAPDQFNSNKANRYGGAYTFTMPENDVEITATFKSASNFYGNDYITLVISGGDTYNGITRNLVVTNTLTHVTLAEGNDFQITSQKIKQGTEDFTDISAIKDAGTYKIEITGLGTYYNSKTVSTLVIEKADLTITPKNKSRQYRYANPTYGNKSSGTDGDFTYEGLQNGETNSVLTTQPSATIAADINSNIGDYTVTASGAAAANYNISYSPGTLTITRRDVNSSNIAEANRAQATLSEVNAIYADFNTDHYYKYDPSSVETHQPSVSVIDSSDDNKELILNTDYTVAYDVEAYGDASCQTPGMYTAAVTFIGNYTGNVIVKKYQIRKEVTLNSSSNYQWSTFYDKTYNMEVMDGFQAFTFNGIYNNAVMLENKTVIKAGMPMLLFKPGTTYADFYPPLIAPSDGRLNGWSSDDQYKCKVDGNGTPIAWNLDQDNYITSGATKIMILVDDKFVRTKSGTLAAGKCYLDVSDYLSLAREFYIDEEYETTDIEEVDAQMEEDEYYDLSGRRVLNPTRGIYIMNGKKIIIK